MISMRGSIYPKATAPLTWAVYQMANDRAERWRIRHAAAAAEIERLKTRIKELEEA